MGDVVGDENAVKFVVGGCVVGIRRRFYVVETADKLITCVGNNCNSWWAVGVIAVMDEAKSSCSSRMASSGYANRVPCAEALIRALEAGVVDVV